VSHDTRKLSGKTLGLDLGDRSSRFCLLGADGKVLKEGHVGTTRTALRRKFAGDDPMRVVIETGTHSPWVADLFKELGHEVIIADARRLQLIARNRRKSSRAPRRDPSLHLRVRRKAHRPAVLRIRDSSFCRVLQPQLVPIKIQVLA